MTVARLGIDVDGVLADFGGAFRRVIEHTFPGRIPAQYIPDTWDWPNKFLTKKEVGTAWRVFNSKWNAWLYLRALPGVAELAQGMGGHDVWAITSRAQTQGMTAQAQTEEWLRQCQVDIPVITVPDSNQKAALVQAMELDGMLDDKGDTIVQIDGLHPALTRVKGLLLSQPWNAGVKVKRRVASVKEFFNAF